MLSSTVSSSFFPLCWQSLGRQHVPCVDDHFLEQPCAREQKRDNGPEQAQLFFVGRGSVPFIGAVIRLLVILYNDFFESHVYHRVLGSGGFSMLLNLNMI